MCLVFCQQPPDHDDLCEVNFIESVVYDFFRQLSYDDPLENYLAHFGMSFDDDVVISEVNSLLESAPLMNTTKWKVKIEPLPPSESMPHPSVDKPPKLELKPLPETLKYAFLG